MTQFFGKYAGKVENNIDPEFRGRLQVSVPAVLGDGTLSWAMPCAPYGGSGVGLFMIPPTGANVWVEFAGGDPDHPIWAGCFWGLGEAPAPPGPTQTMVKMIKTDTITLTIDDTPGAGGVTLEVATPAVAVPIKLVMDSSGVELTLDPVSVKIATTAVEVSHAPASVKIAPTGVEVAVTPSTLKVEPAGLELANAAATLKLAPSSVDLKNGGASVSLTPATVSINNGALEVM
jgi:hypothetical protein